MEKARKRRSRINRNDSYRAKRESSEADKGELRSPTLPPDVSALINRKRAASMAAREAMYNVQQQTGVARQQRQRRNATGQERHLGEAAGAALHQ